MSNVKKMIGEAAEDRIIDTLTQPFTLRATPYPSDNFSEITQKFCRIEDSVISNLINICKVIVIGDVSVGKTSIINRFCQKIFDWNYKSTIGVDFEVERFDILKIPFNLQIWDTAGQERFKCIAQSYYRGSHAVVLVFDLTDLSTLQHTKTWLSEALEACSSTSPFIFLVGTKSDLIGKFAYKHLELSAIKMANSLKAEYWSVSSKTGKNINNLFFRIAGLTFDKTIQKEASRPSISKQIGSSDVISFKRSQMAKANKEKSCSGLKCQ